MALWIHLKRAQIVDLMIQKDQEVQGLESHQGGRVDQRVTEINARLRISSKEVKILNDLYGKV